MADAKALFEQGEPAAAIFSRGEMDDSLAQKPQEQIPAPTPGRSFGGKVVDTVSDALPPTMALVGGAAGTMTGPAALATVPLGGAAGYGMGELLKRYVDMASGRPGKPPPVDVLSSAAKGASEGMGAYVGGQWLGRIGSELKAAPALAEGLGAAGNPFGNLSDKAFGAVHGVANLPAKPIMSAPRGELAEIGAKFASPASAEAAQRGAGHLDRLASPLAQDAEIGARGARGDTMQAAIDEFLRKNVTPLADASGRAIDKVSEALPPRLPEVTAGEAGVRPELADDPHGWIPPAPGGRNQPPFAHTARLLHPAIEPVQGPALPPGGDVVNQSFNAPGGQNSVVRSPEAMHAIADVKSLGLENRAGGAARRGAFTDKLRADSQGITPAVAEQAGSDATELDRLSRTLMRQRGGIQQQGPSGILPRTLYESQKLLAGPRSTMAGFRPETPESALQNNSIRLAELEAHRRGMPALDEGARYRAMFPQPRPVQQGGLRNAAALTGADAETLRQFLSSIADRQQQK